MDQSLITNTIGAAAALISVSSFAPQILKMLKTHDVSGVSYRTYALTVACFALWVLYGIRLGAWPLVASNTAALLMSGTVLALKWRYDREA